MVPFSSFYTQEVKIKVKDVIFEIWFWDIFYIYLQCALWRWLNAILTQFAAENSHYSSKRLYQVCHYTFSFYVGQMHLQANPSALFYRMCCVFRHYSFKHMEIKVIHMNLNTLNIQGGLISWLRPWHEWSFSATSHNEINGCCKVMRTHTKQKSSWVWCLVHLQFPPKPQKDDHILCLEGSDWNSHALHVFRTWEPRMPYPFKWLS